MSKPAIQRRHDELYHYNHRHDRLGRFASANRGTYYDNYLGADGRLTDKAERRLGTKRYTPEDPTSPDSSIQKALRNAFDRVESKDKKKKDGDNSNSDNSNTDATNDNGGKKKKDGNNGNNNNNDENGGGKKKKGEDSIRVTEAGYVHPDDQNKAIGKIEKEIAKDYGNVASAYGNSSKLANQALSMNDSLRKTAAQRKAQSLDLSGYSDADLRSYINRSNLERQYRDVIAGDFNTGRSKLDYLLEYGGSILAMGATAASIAVAIHNLRS